MLAKARFWCVLERDPGDDMNTCLSTHAMPPSRDLLCTMLAQAALSNARPEIGDYAFTTLRPQLGLVHNGGQHFMAGVHDSATLADIPGLIQGAHANRGLVRRY